MNKYILTFLLLTSCSSTEEIKRLPYETVDITVDIRKEDFTNEDGFFDRYSHWYTGERARKIARQELKYNNPNRTEPLTVIVRPIEDLQ